MLFVIFWTILFSIVTVISIVLMGSRTLIEGELTLEKIFSILVDWRFLIGAFLAFLARMFFIFINNNLLRIPELAPASTTITAFITSVAMIFVIIANYFFLGERLSFTQGIGTLIILVGIFLITLR